MDDVSEIRWRGWVTSISALKADGWVFTHKSKYRNWRDSKNTSAANDYLYLRHPILKMIGRIKILEHASDCWVLDFLTPEKNQRSKPPKYTEYRDYSEEDVQPMLDIIAEIQSRRPKRRKKLPSAEVFELEKIA